MNISANLSVSIQSWLSTSFGHWPKFGVQMHCVWVLNALPHTPELPFLFLLKSQHLLLEAAEGKNGDWPKEYDATDGRV